MKVLRGDPATWEAPPEGSVVTIGVYDGVHRGHHRVLARVVARAEEIGARAVVLTFNPHPLALIAPQRAPRLLTTIEQRLDLFGRLGLELAAVLTFDERTRNLGPEAFVEQVLVQGLAARVVAVGEDFRFGRDRAGDVEILAELGERYGFVVEPISLVEVGGEALSSTAIRRAIAAGDVEEAARGLGRCPTLRGIVMRGDARGQQLGFPTANLEVPLDVVIPARGIYAGWARIGEKEHPAAISVGVRPTFADGEAEVVEAYLLDFEADLYGRELDIGLCERLRDEQRFDSVEELVEQMHRDVEEVRRRQRAAATGESIAGFFDREACCHPAGDTEATVSGVSEMLLSELEGAGLAGRTVLELGCGMGSLALAALRAGATRVTGIDISPGSIEVARRRAQEADLADRSTFEVGDGANSQVGSHDLVVMDKVFCCYPFVESLLTHSLDRAERLYGYSLPASVGFWGSLARMVIFLENLWRRLRGDPFRAYVHDVGRIETRVRGQGFRPIVRSRWWTWQVAVYLRDPPQSAPR
ncbi:MAG: bifunctional riboflavin kinase/FAD synthetase [Acidimicrobiia bacterium]